MTSQGAVDWTAILAQPGVRALMDLAVQEDVGGGDITTRAIFAKPQRVTATVITRGPTVACGLPLAEALLRRFDLEVSNGSAEGQKLTAGAPLMMIRGEVGQLLTIERCVLNFLMRLCGVAHAAHLAVAAVPVGCKAQIYDTRKTTTGWRVLEKAAVRTGGGQNHRVGLFDGVLIKDNHIQAAGSVAEAVRRARSCGLPVEVEIDALAQLDEALQTRAEVILLDNFVDADMAEAVRKVAGRAILEASGGVTLDRLPAIARTGVDRISMGALTHSARPADLSLEF